MIEVFNVEYRVAGKLLFLDNEWYSTIPEPGQRIPTVEGPTLQVVKTLRQPELSRAVLDCEGADRVNV